MNIKIPYGLKGTKLIHISKVSPGLACECVCPACYSRLVAKKKAESRQEHFAHYGEGCSKALETTLHLFAKEILEQERKFMYPSLKRHLGEFGLQTLIFEKEIAIDKVYLEKKLDDIIPDVILEIKGKKILVEIAVTHFIEKEKREKIEQIGISTIEIDLSKEEQVFDREVIKQAVVYGFQKKNWIFNAKEESLREELLENLIEKKRRRMEMALKEENRIRDLTSYCFSQGFDMMKTDEYNEVLCPKKSENTAQQIKSPTAVVMVIANGGKWNGTFYGHRPNGKYIFIDREKFWIYSPDSHTISDEESKKQNLTFAQLGEIKRKSLASLKECEQCPFFVDYVNDFDFFCEYRVKRISKKK